MLEVLFILVTVFVVYVVVTGTAKQVKKVEPVETKPTPTSNKEKKTTAKTTKKNVAKKEKSVPKNTKTTKAAVETMPTGTLRNPETGDVDKIASSYRMLKRWIKEALVKEGLLDKIYKINELDAAAKQKINNAVNELKQMEDYQ